jgi:hypothetical protein
MRSIFSQNLRPMSKRLDRQVHFGQEFTSVIQTAALMLDDALIEDSTCPAHRPVFRKQFL